ncbi:MAG TPA: hypothetical protein VM364_07865 [Vicinamibacterales bacterium]|nr:hypothetical protein [Vicinamibacterales bacterium]
MVSYEKAQELRDDAAKRLDAAIARLRETNADRPSLEELAAAIGDAAIAEQHIRLPAKMHDDLTRARQLMSFLASPMGP